MENNKKILVPTIIAVVTLILLAFGATYAYFTVGSTNNFGTKDLNANIQDMADAVVLEQIENELSLDVTRAMMSEDNAGTYYYASGSSTPANIAKMSVAGEGRYACDYTLSVTKSASSPENDLYTAFQGMSTKSWNQLFLKINNGNYDFLSTNLFPITYSGTIGGITKNTPQYITTNLAIVNTNSNQNALKGKDITLTFEVTSFDCYLSEADESAPIYAIYSEEKCSYYNQEEGFCVFSESGPFLAFYQNHDEVNVGDTYDGYTVTEVYTNLNNTNYTSVNDVPWYSHDIEYINIEDVIRPKNLSYWFAGVSVINASDKLDTSQVINMSHMFENSGSRLFEVNLSTWDTSNVTDMSYMFAHSSINPSDLSTWDTSNVTDMSYMFADIYYAIDFDLSTWDTSNVTNMSHMFENTGSALGFSIGDITRREVTANGKTYIAWDTSKVTDMSYMFNEAGSYTTYNLNLSSWQVPLVTNYTNFNKGVESNITPPTWVS